MFLTDCLLLFYQSEVSGFWCFSLGSLARTLFQIIISVFLHHSFSHPYMFICPKCISVTGHLLIFCAAFFVLVSLPLFRICSPVVNILRMQLSNLWFFINVVLFGFGYCHFCYNKEANRFIKTRYLSLSSEEKQE